MAEFTINGKPVIAADIQKKIAKNADLEMRLSRAAQFVRHGGLMWRFFLWGEGVIRKDREGWQEVLRLKRAIDAGLYD